MCYIFSCFAWLLDFIQRAITFVLACILCCVIGVGIIVAIAAGVAYGYNYSMAEFLTFTKQDITVYMRRGQFYDKPDFDADRELFIHRRSGGDDDFGVNKSEEYQDTNSVSNAKGLPDTWSQIKDTRKYAEELTKFSRPPVDDEPRPIDQPMNLRIQTVPTETPHLVEYVPPVRRVSLVQQPSLMQTTVMQSGFSNIIMRKFQPPSRKIPPMLPMQPPLMLTTEMQSGSSKIIMRNFQPPSRTIPPTTATLPNVEIHEIPDEDHSVDRSFYDEEPERRQTKFFQLPPTRTSVPSPSATQFIPMRHWAKPKPESDPDYRDEFDEDSVVYKPV